MHFRFYNTSRSLFMSFPVNIKILLLAFIHSINLKKAGVGQPKYCNNAYVHVVLTNLCRIFSILKYFLSYGAPSAHAEGVRGAPLLARTPGEFPILPTGA